VATTQYGLNSVETVKLWSRKLYREALKRTYIYKFIGESSDSLIHQLNDANKGPGDRIRVILRMLLSGTGIQGDATLEGNEEALTTFTDDVTIDQLRHAVRSAGKMSEQRIPFSVREEARTGLADWWADRLDRWFFNQVAGLGREADVRYTGMQATVEPDTSHILFGPPGSGLTTEATVGSATVSNRFSLAMIDNCVLRAKTLSPQVRPIRINGNDHFAMFLHPEQVYDLRNDVRSSGAAVISWHDIQVAAMQGGDVTNNPIFTGALGMYNNVVLHESTRVPNGGSVTATHNSTVRRAIFCGAQAAGLAFGQGYGENQMSWVEELFDFRNQLGVSAGMIAGLKKSRFNAADFGTLVQVSSITNPSGVQ